MKSWKCSNEKKIFFPFSNSWSHYYLEYVINSKYQFPPPLEYLKFICMKDYNEKSRESFICSSLVKHSYYFFKPTYSFDILITQFIWKLNKTYFSFYILQLFFLILSFKSFPMLSRIRKICGMRVCDVVVREMKSNANKIIKETIKGNPLFIFCNAELNIVNTKWKRKSIQKYQYYYFQIDSQENEKNISII